MRVFGYAKGTLNVGARNTMEAEGGPPPLGPGPYGRWFDVDDMEAAMAQQLVNLILQTSIPFRVILRG